MVQRSGSSEDLPSLDHLDWDVLFEQIDNDGVAVTPQLLSRPQCQNIIDSFDEPDLFRSTVVMQRYQFGRGVYKYFADPAGVPLVQHLRQTLYPPMARIANEWARRLNERAYPESLDQLLAECADHGQHRPTPLILQYGAGDYACLHQDIYGDVVFPLQIAIMLNQPGEDFNGGENVFVEQRPRSQSRAMVVKPQLGEGMIFPVRHRPVRGKNGFRRNAMRHDTNAVLDGHRNTLGLIFHNAR